MAKLQDPVDFFDMVGQTEWDRSIQRTLIHWMGMHDHHKVLDVGCGAGRLVMQMAQRCRWVTGIDKSDGMVKRASLNAEDFHLDNTNFVVGDVYALPFLQDQYDWVTCINTLFLLDQPVTALREMLRVVKPGGQLIVLNPSTQMNPWTAQSYCEKHNRRDFERDSLLSLATAAARRDIRDLGGFQRDVEQAGGRVLGTLLLLDGLGMVSRVVSV